MFLNFKACKHDHYFPSLCKLLACSAPVFLQVHTSVSPRNNSHEFIGAEVLMCCRPIERLAEGNLCFHIFDKAYCVSLFERCWSKFLHGCSDWLLKSLTDRLTKQHLFLQSDLNPPPIVWSCRNDILRTCNLCEQPSVTPASTPAELIRALGIFLGNFPFHAHFRILERKGQQT